MGEAAILHFDARQEQTSCGSCGVIFSAPAGFIQRRREDGKSFWCPNGHVLSWHTTEVDRLKKELAEKERALVWERDAAKRARESRDAAERRASAARGQVTKIKNRVGNGVCPCCNRTFQNLMRHMSTKHPGYRDEGALEQEGPPEPAAKPHGAVPKPTATAGTISQRVIDYVTAHPGVTSGEVGKAMGAATMLSTLALAKKLRRERNDAGLWCYYPAGSPSESEGESK